MAIVSSQIVFAAVIFFVLAPAAGSGPSRGIAPEPIPVLETVATIAGIAAIPVAFLVRRTIWVRAAPDPRAILPATIVFSAILEGASVFNLVVWMLNGSLFPNGVVAGVLILVAIGGFPRGE
jgi:hypothetical protein